MITKNKSNLNWRFYPAIWHLNGVAQTADNEKPGVAAPIENLFAIGNCVKKQRVSTLIVY